MASAISEAVKEKRKHVFLDELPDDFLRIPVFQQQEQQEAVDRQTALALHQQFLASRPYLATTVGWLRITLVQARLAKNYGIIHMDPYPRVRVGHCIYERHTYTNAGKNPIWNEVFQFLLHKGVKTISLDIFDECSFKRDELIAWTTITIPQQVLAGETLEDWYPLNGKQGEGMEGMINLVWSFIPVPQSHSVGPPVMHAPNFHVAKIPVPMAVHAAPANTASTSGA